MNKMPVGKTIAYAYAFTFGNLGTVIGIMWLPIAVLAAAAYFAFAPGIETITTLVASGAKPTSQEAALIIRQIVPGLLLYLLLVWFLGSMMAVGLTRAALGLDHGRGIFFSVGRQVWLMMGAIFIYFVIYVVAEIVLALARAAIAGAVGAAVQDQQTAILTDPIVALVMYIILIYINLRLGFLLAPVTVAENKIDLKRGWDLTSGNVWRMFFISLGIALPVLLLLFAVGYGTIQAFVPDFTLERPALHEAPQEMWIVLGAAYLVFSILYYSMMYGANAFAYRALVPAAGAPAATG